MHSNDEKHQGIVKEMLDSMRVVNCNDSTTFFR